MHKPPIKPYERLATAVELLSEGLKDFTTEDTFPVALTPEQAKEYKHELALMQIAYTSLASILHLWKE